MFEEQKKYFEKELLGYDIDQLLTMSIKECEYTKWLLAQDPLTFKNTSIPKKFRRKDFG